MRQLRRIATRSAIVLRRKLEAFVLAPSPPPAAAAPVLEGSTDLHGKIVVVTGSSRGIGLEVARAFAKAGAHVVLSGRDATRLASAASEIERTVPGARLAQVAGDVSTEAGARVLVETAVSRFGGIDVLVNNAALTGRTDRKLWELSHAEFAAVLAGNVTGPWLCLREAVLAARRLRRPLRIVNVSSGIAGFSAPGLGAYAVSKWALEGITAAVAGDAPGEEVPVSVVSIRPPSVKTEMTKDYYPWEQVALMDPPEVLGATFVWAASAPAGEIQGKSLLEPAFRVDPLAEMVLNSPYAAAPRWRLEPEHCKRDEGALRAPRDGAYMHLLENPWGMSPAAADALAHALVREGLERYPDPSYTNLRRSLSERHGLDPACFAFGNGSSEILERMLRTFARPQRPVVVTRPTWSLVHVFAGRLGLRLVEVPYLGSLEAGDLHHDLEGLLRAVDLTTSLVYLVNPCNPTGSMLAPDAVADFVERLPAHVTFVLDEAYVEFAEPSLRLDLAPLLARARARVVGLRTFSKFFGLSGFRVGYAYARPEVIGLLERSEIPFAVANVSEAAAVASLSDTGFQTLTFEGIRNERARVMRRLRALGIPHLPSQTHFLVFDAPLSHEKLRAWCKERGLFLPVVDFYTKNYGVLPIGRPEHDDVVLEFLGRH